MILLLLALVLVLIVFVKFVRADGDFTLLSKGKPKRQDIQDKVFWITGASRGIGEVLATQLAALGAKLIISARTEAELQRVKTQLVGTGKHASDGVKILPLDLASGEDALREAVKAAHSFFPDSGVDYMIHNAAYERPVSHNSLHFTYSSNNIYCVYKL
ncbi:Dehydrogenase/reductase SDR family member [Thalictrum thalictroides]|uniref:Dehydrogenase/reductase SDR family member n=1 Tax=Thalictrum thalictroides TaxID=46969 RepID=A0A7J6XC73_THATH|nr:Dehydrogenase/reductase SDR family member [Thalictrum thalictroides]